MPFINKKQAFKLLDDMIAGKQNCIGDCRRIWLRNIGYALKTETNPLKLTGAEHKKLTAKLVKAKDRKKQNVTKKKDKKYLMRDSPPYPANKHCGETKKGNDGKMYTSIPDKNNICKWKRNGSD
jgi:hypothetical protein